MGTTWLSQTGGAHLLPDSEGPLQELDPQDRVTQCRAGLGTQTNLPFPESVSYLSVPLAIYLAAYAPSRRLTITKEVVFTVLLTAIILLGMGV